MADSFDGHDIAIFEGKFGGAFDVDSAVASSMQIDDVLTFVVTARVAGASMDETRLGDLKRTNKLQVMNVLYLNASSASKILGGYDRDFADEPEALESVPEERVGPEEFSAGDRVLQDFLYSGTN